MGWAGRLRPRGLGWLVAVTAILVIIAAVAGEPWWPIVVTAVTGVAASIFFTAVRRWRGVAGAQAAYQQAIDSGDADAAAWAAADMGVLLAEQGDVAGAKAAYQRAIDFGHGMPGCDAAPAAAFNLGLLLEQQGDGAGAQAAYQQAIDSGHAELAPRAAVSLGVLLAEQGDVAGAKAAYQRAIDSGHADEAPRAAHLLSELS